MASNYTLSMDCILKESRNRWLKGFEVLWVLQNYQKFGLQLSTAPPSTAPTSGSLFLYNKRTVKFKKDNINWKKQKDGKGVKESHERLKVGGVRAISCSYATAEDDEKFHRRTYWLIDGDTNTVLVHYLNDAVTVTEERPVLQATPISVPLTQSFGNTNNMFIPQNFSAFPQYTQPPMFTPPYTPMPTPAQNFQGNFVKPFPYQPTPTFESTPSSQVFDPSLLLNNDEWSEEDEIERDAETLSDLTSLDENSIMMMKHFDDEPINLEEMPTPIEEARASPAIRISKLARITDFSPEWDFTEGGAKVLVTSPDFVPGHQYFCLFDNTEVAGELIQSGVIRCIVPPHAAPGYVSFCVTLGNFMMFSEVKQFEYRKSKQENELLSMTERNFKVRIVDRLEKLVYALNSVNNKGNTTTDENGQAQIIEQVILKILSTLFTMLPTKSTVDLQDEDGFSLLHCSCALGYSTVALRLIDYGADVNLKDKFGLTPFHWAVKKGDERLVNLLAELTDLDSVAYHVESEEMDRLMAAFSEIELEDFKQSIKDAYTQDLSLERAATRIQSLYRGHKAREEARRQRQLQEIQKDAARKILSAYRKHRQRFWSKLEATAVIIQTRMRAKWAQRKKEKENEAAKKIQHAFKKYQYRQKSFVHM